MGGKKEINYWKYPVNISILNYLKNTQWTNLIGFHGDDGAQGEDEGVNIFHVQVICGHGVGHGVSG